MAESRYLSRRALWLNRLSEEVVRGLSDRIRAGALAEGDRLPDRETLMVEFVTSATVVERALETLEAEGLVTRDAEGVLRVATTQRRPESLEFPQTGEATRADVIFILELRTGVEAEAAALAAERRTEVQIAAIRKAQADFEAAAETGSGVAQSDFQFRLAIAEASGNHYLRELTEYLGPLLIPRMRVPLTPDAGRNDPNLGKARKEHAAIFEAIAGAEAEAAREAMRRHLTRSVSLVRSLDEAI